MAFFNETIAALAQGRTVYLALLVSHDFESGIAYNWTGYGALDLDGVTWIGKGDLVSFGGIPFNADDVAGAITITLSGVEPQFIAEARTMPPIRGRAQQIWLQFFDATTLQPLDDKLLIADRVMDVMRWSGSGPSQRSVSVTSEDIWADRNICEYANWSNADQQALFPGDRGLEFVAEMVPGKRVDWPNFSV
jgi:hypothetical protein